MNLELKNKYFHKRIKIMKIYGYEYLKILKQKIEWQNNRHITPDELSVIIFEDYINSQKIHKGNGDEKKQKILWNWIN